MKTLKVGSRWWAGQGEKFIIVDIVTIEGYTWVHYRDDNKENPREYSCYSSSFLSRFSEMPK